MVASGIAARAPIPMDNPITKSLSLVTVLIVVFYATKIYYFKALELAPLTNILIISPNLDPATKKSVSYLPLLSAAVPY